MVLLAYELSKSCASPTEDDDISHVAFVHRLDHRGRSRVRAPVLAPSP